MKRSFESYILTMVLMISLVLLARKSFVEVNLGKKKQRKEVFTRTSVYRLGSPFRIGVVFDFWLLKRLNGFIVIYQ